MVARGSAGSAARIDYAETYSKMSDDEILDLAADLGALTEEARNALTEELNRRKLSDAAVDEYRRYLDAVKPGDWPGREKHVGYTVNGFGVSLYGKRDFRPDGSFITTKWFVFFWLPLVPLRSMRVVQLGPTGSAWPLGWSTQYAIHSESWPNTRQVFSVYSFLMGLALSLASAQYVPSYISLVFCALVCAIPWLLRRAARNEAR